MGTWDARGMGGPKTVRFGVLDPHFYSLMCRTLQYIDLNRSKNNIIPFNSIFSNFTLIKVNFTLELNT